MNSGANDSVINNKFFFIDQYDDSPVIINVAGDLQVFATCKGYILFNGDLLGSLLYS